MLYERYAKRVIDLVLGIVILVILSPVFLILMIMIKLDSSGPVFFRQKRLGRDKTYFSILKFRTMRTDAPKDMPTHLLQHPDAFIVVTGCSAELDRELHLADGAADLVLSNPEKREIGPRILEALSGLPAHHRAALSLEEPVSAFAENAESRFPFRSRAFLKIQEGCDNYCTYCIVPYARGHERSRRFDEVIEDCRRAVGAGFPELVLTGVNTCAYRDAGRNLGALVREICAIEGDFRVRLSSTEPHPANRELIDVIASEPKVCRFLHLALQHGSDRILERMNRHYRRAEYADFVRDALVGRLRMRGLVVGYDHHFGKDREGNFESLQLLSRQYGIFL